MEVDVKGRRRIRGDADVDCERATCRLWAQNVGREIPIKVGRDERRRTYGVGKTI